MPVKEGGSVEGEDEDRRSCSADSRRGYPKIGLQRDANGARDAPRGWQSSPGGLRTDLSIFGLC